MAAPSKLSAHFGRAFLGLAALGLAVACSDSPVEPENPGRLAWSSTALDLGTRRSGGGEVANEGGQALGPVTIEVGMVRDAGGAAPPGVFVRPEPASVPTLNPGQRALVDFDVVVGSTLTPGRYEATVTARSPEGIASSFVLAFEVVASTGAASIRIVDPPVNARQGDVVPLALEVVDSTGVRLEGSSVAWRMRPADAGLITGNGAFVGYRTGAVTLVAEAGEGVSDSVTVTLTERRVEGSFTVLGRTSVVDRYTSDLWIHGDYAYTGTWGIRPGPDGLRAGNTMTTWRVSDPSHPVRLSSLEVDARTVNDVKIRADGRLGVLTHEASFDGQNGVTFLDMSDPSHPADVGRYTVGLESGIHNAWLDGSYAYLVRDGPDSGLRILDVSDPSSPTEVASFYAGSSFLHDVYVRDGLAFLSHWNAGLVILDVGNGMAGGSPQAPAEVARIQTAGGQTHNAWYWPEGGYVFVGEEDFAAPGILHVVDVHNLRSPKEVATFSLPGDTPHNIWLDEDRAVLYMAWYANGIRALDVSGTLLGELDRQNREIAGAVYNGGNGGCNRGSADTCTWAPQLVGGTLWVSDMNTGLVALSPPR